jgi:methyl-accepting chemotaxis protein PixJ
MLLEDQPANSNTQSPLAGKAIARKHKDLQLITDLAASKQAQSSSLGKGKKFLYGWGSLSLQWKLSIFLAIATAVPVIAVTQLLTKDSADRLLSSLRESVQEKGTVFAEEYVLWTKEEAKADTALLAQLIEGQEIDLSNPSDLTSRGKILQPFLTINNDASPESIKSFKILTNAQGKTVAQTIQIVDEDFSKLPQLPANKESLTPQKYRFV